MTRKPVSTQTDRVEATLSLRRRLLSLNALWEVSIIIAAYFAYMLARRFLISDIEAVAFENARKLIDFERAIGIFQEAAWQAWMLEHLKAIVIMFNWAYIITFIPILLVTAAVLYAKDRTQYAYYRNVWLISFVLALVVFMVFPLAPPRFLPEHGFVDSIQRYGPTWYGGSDMAKALYYNVYAAMPSLHFGWTVLFGVLYFRMGPLSLKVVGVLYPTMTFLAITITGNHYIMDAVGGLAVAVASYASYEALLWLIRLVRRRVHDRRVGTRRRTARPRPGTAGAPAPALRDRPAPGRSSPAPALRGLVLRWRVAPQVMASKVRSHPLVERVYLHPYARKWRTGVPG